MVCLSILRNIIFTTAAIDNIDHNSTTTTFTASFHGTSTLPGYSLLSLQTLKIVEEVGYNIDLIRKYVPY